MYLIGVIFNKSLRVLSDWVFYTRVCMYICIGEKKLSKIIVPDKWKEGAHNATEGGGRKINENKLLSKKHRSTNYLLLFFS